MTAIVFLGPTLSVARARETFDATYLGPAGQGDVYRASCEHPRAIGLVDGYFEHRLATWHKEVLWALTRGIRVYGSSSIGALRAAELAKFGMIGVGRVFDMYRSGELEDDDEVALVHQPATQGYAPSSEAMVNIRATLAEAVRDGVLEEQTGAALRAVAKTLFYPDRSFLKLFHVAASRGVDPTELGRLQAWLPAHRVDVKRADAVLMLERMARDCADPAWARPSCNFCFEHTEAWEEFVQRVGPPGPRKRGIRMPA